MLMFASVTPEGAFIEIGCHAGGTTFHLAQLAYEQDRSLIACDTFEGIPSYQPERGDVITLGDVHGGTLEEVIAKFPQELHTVTSWVKGEFPDSMTGVASPRIAFALVDVDTYKGYSESLEWLRTRMVPGGIIWLDEAHIPNILTGCMHATEEFMAKYPHFGRLVKDVVGDDTMNGRWWIDVACGRDMYMYRGSVR